MGRRPVRNPAVRIVRYRAAPPQRTDGALALDPVQATARRRAAASEQKAEASPGSTARAGSAARADSTARASGTARTGSTARPDSTARAGSAARAVRRGAPPGPLRVVRPGDGVESEVRAVADTTLRIVVEVLAGTRPPHQLSLVAVPAVCRGLAPHRRAVPGGRRIVPPRVLSSRLQRPSPTVAETSAVVVVAGRVHAVALRLQHLRGRWRCTAVETTAP